MQKETVQQFAAKLGRCPICWETLGALAYIASMI